MQASPASGRTHPSPREPLLPHASQVRPFLKTLITPVGSPRLRTSPADPRAPEATNPGDTRVSSKTRTTADRRGLSTAATCTEARHRNRLCSNSTNSPHLNLRPPPRLSQRLPLPRPTSSPRTRHTRPRCPPRSPRQSLLFINRPKGRVTTYDHRSRRHHRPTLTFCPARRDRKRLRFPSPHPSPRPNRPPLLLLKRQNAAPPLSPPRWIQSATAWTPASRCSSKRNGQNFCLSSRNEIRTLRC